MTEFFTLLRREMRRFLSLPNQTIFPPVLIAVLYILIFGYSIGSRIETIHGFPYIVFILPGLVMMGVVNSGYSNSTTSLFIARRENFIQDLLVSPLSYLKIVAAYILGATTRGVIVGLLTLTVAFFLIDLPVKYPLLMLLFLALTSGSFGSFGLLVGLWAERWDNIAIFLNYLVTPLIFLGGVFYSIQDLPQPWRTVSLFNPLFYMVDGFRFSLLGVSEVSPLISFSILTTLFLIMTATAIHLFKIGWKLRD